ncbi:lariat debranching enzyme, C-terminal domain-containing protein, partial [Echria macrotheca]
MADTAPRGVRIAVEGCGHGTLNAIYAAVERSCKERGWDTVDAVIIGGDFQAVRNAADLSVMSVPPKYRELADFPEYYAGTRTAPYLTLFIAGNHEAAAHLWELYYGGWVAPNIYYLGAANVLRLGPLRIAGMSGIWKGFDYRKAHHERLPFSQDDVKSFYHVREIDVRKLLQVRTQVDVGLSHDWPRGIERHGNRRHLFNMKPDFERESNDGTLGNPAAEYVMDRLRPPYWFSAHLHCKFTAIKTYDDAPPETATEQPAAPEPPAAAPVTNTTTNPDEIDLDMDDDEDEGEKPPPTKTEPAPETETDETEALRAQLPASFAKPTTTPTTVPKTTPGQPVPPSISNKTVRFLALDKCLPGRKFLQLLEIPIPTTSSSSPPPPPSPYKLSYDPEWLAITRVFSSLTTTIGDRNITHPPPDEGEAHYRPLIEAEERWVDEHIVKTKKLAVPENFVQTAPPHVPGQHPELTDEQPDEYTNPQTVAFCELVGVPNLWDASEEERRERREKGPPPAVGYDGSRGGR